MKKKLLILFLCVFSVNAFTQENKDKKSNPIIFAEASLGIINYGNKGKSIYVEVALFYQKNSHLFSLKQKILGGAPFSLKKPKLINSAKEFSFLYGKRFFDENFSYSFSAGISLSKTHERNSTTNEYNKKTFIGIPLELSLRSIKGEKKKKEFSFFKPTAFGISAGLKIFGNLSKHPYIGLGIIIGLGYYKNYH